MMDELMELLKARPTVSAFLKGMGVNMCADGGTAYAVINLCLHPGGWML